ncbi:MAG: ribosome biogenesis GTPase Der [Firmicutes bacterium]|nr:ribosome biogenesis GTPase Der [Bacillota bacterium]
MSGLVAVVGRPNVGKSTLFNRILGRREAIVEGTPGITRDRFFAEAAWDGRLFGLVDTGGLILDGEDEENDLSRSVRRQAEMAIEQADVLLWVVDGKTGVIPQDRDVSDILRQGRRPVILVVNKVDNPAREHETAAEFYELGFNEVMTVSALHGHGLGDLLSRVVDLLPEGDSEPPAEKFISVAVVGRPNVGKSSLVNALCGEERVVVSDQPGTTRDAVDTLIERDGLRMRLVDTAGLRRQARVGEAAERFGALRALRALERCEVALFVLDATTGRVSEQDRRIGGYIQSAGRASILVVNKWDLAPVGERVGDEIKRALTSELDYLDYSPVVFISAVTGRNLGRLVKTVGEVAAEFHRRVPDEECREVVLAAASAYPPPGSKGRPMRILGCRQSRTAPPTFRIQVSGFGELHFSYIRYLENELRGAFGFPGCPLIVKVTGAKTARPRGKQVRR